MIDLKLDTHAVLKLFDTEEARANLQQSVINNVVKELVLKNSKNKVQETIQKEISLVGARLPDVSPMVKEELERFFTKKGWNEAQGTLALDKMMRDAAARLARDRVLETITTLVDENIAELQERIERTLKLSEERMESMISTALQNRFDKALNAAIAQRVKFLFPGV